MFNLNCKFSNSLINKITIQKIAIVTNRICLEKYNSAVDFPACVA